MRWSQTLIPTLREDPSEAESPSHRLMLRGGFVRQLSAGVYTYLPLGTRSLLKVTNIVREEMDRAGAVEVFLSVLAPPELWKETGRYELYGDVLMKLRDRKGTEHVLCPTHEEIITDMVRNGITSHRQLPITLYQIQTKFRDEPRPRFGVVRTREFIMKDAYSFDVDMEHLATSYKAMYDAYNRIFTRAGLDFMPVEADSGAMGGDASHEFISKSVNGEDVVVTCPKCGYAANREKAEVPEPESSFSGKETQELLATEEVATPNAKTIEEVAKFLKASPRQLVKTLIYQTNEGPIAALLRGDHEVNEAKLARAAGVTSLEMATPEAIQKATGGPLGFSGPIGLDIRTIVDHAVPHISNFITGANKNDTHVLNVNCNRDFKPTVLADIRLAGEGDPCVKCKTPVRFTTGIEVGHVFKLGTRYSEAMGAVFQDEKGEKKPCVMGCYGIGVTRILAAALENHHDDNGAIWPKEIAPYQVHVVTVNPNDEKILGASQKVVESLEQKGWEVFWDDREQPAGVKFADADLIGLPVRVTVGSRTVKKGTVDVKTRTEKDQKSVPLDDVEGAVKDAWDRFPF